MPNTRTFSHETYKKMGCPDLGRTIYYFDHKAQIRVYGKIVGVKHTRKRMKLDIQLTKRSLAELKTAKAKL